MYQLKLTPLAWREQSIVDILQQRAFYQPNQTAYTFLNHGQTGDISLTYAELDRKAREIGALLQNLGLGGERALLMYPPGMDFIVAFFGCLYAGVVAVPAYPPRRNQSLDRLQSIVEDCQAKELLTTTSVWKDLERSFVQHPELSSLRWIATDNLVSNLNQSWQPKGITADTLAFLQYTSGSTGTPKGVMVTHENLLHNEQMIKRAFGHSETTTHVSWLPLFHDMGLIGNVLQSLYNGTSSILMSPVDFLQKPLRWLEAISHYRATTSGAPNFAYDLCLRKITPEQRDSLDLSCWEVAFNGAEPVRAETLEQFARYFAACGFRRETFYPCYGMAEATLFISGGKKSQPPVIQTVDEKALQDNRVILVKAESENSRALVGAGQEWLDQKIVIVNSQSLTECPADEVGEIWVSGASVTQGYWNRPEQTQEIFHAYLADTKEGPFLRTGDLGFVREDGELFVTGRLKDVIIIRGRNHYPQDIELTVEKSHPSLRYGCGAAFSVEVKGEERLIVVQEVERSYLRTINIDQVIGDIRQALTAQHGLQVYAVVLIKTGSIPKTSSGKIQRYLCRTKFLENKLEILEKREKKLECKSSIVRHHQSVLVSL